MKVSVLAVAMVAACLCASSVDAAGDPADRCRKIYGHNIENIKISILDQQKRVVETNMAYPITFPNNATNVMVPQAQVFVPTKIGYTVEIEWTYTTTPVPNPQTPEEARSAAVDWVGFYFVNYFIGSCIFKYPNEYFPTNRTTIDATQIDNLVNSEGAVRMTVPRAQDPNINTVFTFTGWEVNITGYDSNLYKDSCGNPATRPENINPEQCIIPKTATPTPNPGSDSILPTPTAQTPTSSLESTVSTAATSTPTTLAPNTASSSSSQSSASVIPTPVTSTFAPTPGTQSASPSPSSGSSSRPTLMITVVAGMLALLATCM